MYNEKAIKTIKTLEKFRDSFYEVEDLFEEININELQSVEHYPFNKCFREMVSEVDVWITSLIEDIENNTNVSNKYPPVPKEILFQVINEYQSLQNTIIYLDLIRGMSLHEICVYLDGHNYEEDEYFDLYLDKGIYTVYKSGKHIEVSNSIEVFLNDTDTVSVNI